MRNNDHVKKGQVLFRLKPDAFQTALEGAQAQLGTVRNQVLTLQASYRQSQAQIEQAKADWRAGRMKLPDADDQEFIPLPGDPAPPANPMS